MKASKIKEIVQSDPNATENLEHIVMFVCTMSGRFIRNTYDFSKCEFDYTGETVKFWDPNMKNWIYQDMNDINQIVTVTDWDQPGYQYPDYFYGAGR